MDGLQGNILLKWMITRGVTIYGNSQINKNTVKMQFNGALMECNVIIIHLMGYSLLWWWTSRTGSSPFSQLNHGSKWSWSFMFHCYIKLPEGNPSKKSMSHLNPSIRRTKKSVSAPLRFRPSRVDSFTSIGPQIWQPWWAPQMTHMTHMTTCSGDFCGTTEVQCAISI